MSDSSRKGIGGPKTEEGKLRSSLNAIKNGLHVRSELGIQALEETVGCTYAETLERMRAHFRPMDPLEDVLVRRIARSAWRMLVTEAAENNVLSRCANYVRVGRAYEEVIHTERFIDIYLHRAIAALQRERGREYDKTKNELNPPRQGGHNTQ